MTYNDALARGNMPHSATTASELVAGLTRKFEQDLTEMVEKHGMEEFTPARFRGLLGGLRTLLAGIGREAITQILESRDAPHASIEIDNRRLRYRGKSGREWLSAFGKITVRRRTYRGDGPGAPSCAPLDELCGMEGCYMTPDVEEMAVFGAAMLTANEVEQLLAKVLPQSPSATSIQNAVCRLGTEIEDRREEVEAAIANDAPLSTKGDVLVASWDGVMAPMREDGVTAWREAGVGSVSVYRPSNSGPEKIDTRYFARMPETGMASLVASVAEQVARATAHGNYRAVAVICDGKDAIWNAASKHPVLCDATWILDFYHAAENLMKAAKAIFGDTVEAGRWQAKHRDKMLLDLHGADNARRSMRRYAKLLPAGSDERKVVDNAIAYFREHRDRMRYADFIARGLPIGSGPVESAAKSLVQARLKRSGMRWSHDGGQHVLDLRALLKSDRWEPLWNTLRAA